MTHYRECVKKLKDIKNTLVAWVAAPLKKLRIDVDNLTPYKQVSPNTIAIPPNWQSATRSGSAKRVAFCKLQLAFLAAQHIADFGALRVNFAIGLVSG